MILHFRGFWIDYGWPTASDNFSVNNIISESPTAVDSRINWYLKGGISVLSLRMVVRSKLTNELIGTPEAFTDGKFVWTEEYRYYVENGIILVDNLFLCHMEENDFKTPHQISQNISNEIKAQLFPTNDTSNI